ncbi:hypothetical protein BH11PSE11_BH11PSE11_15470 [soil metagenome]
MVGLSRGEPGSGLMRCASPTRLQHMADSAILKLGIGKLEAIGMKMMKRMTSNSLAAIVLLASAVTSLQSHAASENEISRARINLRCAAFYVMGFQDVQRPELKEKLSELANQNLRRAEILLGNDKPLVKKEFEAARERLSTELLADEVKADAPGFMKFMGEYCAGREQK